MSDKPDNEVKWREILMGDLMGGDGDGGGVGSGWEKSGMGGELEEGRREWR